MRWFAVVFLAFCYGLGCWEYVLLRASATAEQRALAKASGRALSDYVQGLPRAFASPLFKALRLFGVLGVVIVPCLAWHQGLVFGVAALIVFFAGGGAIGIAIPGIASALAAARVQAPAVDVDEQVPVGDAEAVSGDATSKSEKHAA